MELRHLRYFIAVAEEGSLTNAAERRLYTAQPSLSRQIRDLELEVGAKLLERKVRGIGLTPAGRVFLDHARLVLLHVDVATEAARRAEQPAKPAFTVGFLTGQEVLWLPDTLHLLREEAPDIEILISSRSSPELAHALMRCQLDVAFLRHETQTAGLAFRFLAKEPLMAVLPASHRLAARRSVRLQELARETYISMGAAAPALNAVIDDYAARNGIVFKRAYEAENISAAFSLITSIGGMTLFPDSARNVLPSSVVARPLHGEAPTVDLMMGYNKSNTSRLLKRFLSRGDELVTRVAQKPNSLQR
jgi:LysR family hca operon transcriptional activator